MKTHLATFAAGAATGALLAAAVFTSTSDPPAPGSTGSGGKSGLGTAAAGGGEALGEQVRRSRARVAEQEAEITQLVAQVESLRAAAQAGPRVARGAGDSGAGSTPHAGAVTEGTVHSIRLGQEWMDKIRDAEERSRSSQIEAQLAALKRHVDISPEQEERLRQRLSEQGDGIVSLAFKAAGGDAAGAADEIRSLVKRSGPGALGGGLHAALADILEDGQEEGLQRFQEERRANQIEVAANRELLDLQSSLTLTDEQKDAAFALFSQQAEQQADPGAPWSDPEGFQQRHQEKLASLQEILTPEQFEAYRNRHPGTSAGGLSTFVTSGGTNGFTATTVIATTPMIHVETVGGAGSAAASAGVEVEIEAAFEGHPGAQDRILDER